MEQLRKRIFTVMQRHDELPEMSVPLTILMMLGCILFTTAAGKLATPAEAYGAAVSSSGYVGMTASLLFLPVAGCMYASVILLWRKVAALLVTPVCFGVMLWANVRLFPAAVISLSLLLCAYVYATSLISRETKFRRMTALAAASGVCLALTLVGYISLYFGGFGQFSDWYMTALPDALGKVYADSGMAVPHSDLVSGCRQLLLMVPAYTVVAAILLSWITEFLMHTLFRVLECEDLFLETSGRITMPVSYAVVYAVVFLMTWMTPADSWPFLHIVLNSITCAMILPCAAVGLDGVKRALEDKLYFVTGEKMLTAIILAVILGILGVTGFVVIASICGTVVVIRNRLRKEE